MAVAGAATITVTGPTSRVKPYQKAIFSWTSDGAGVVSEVPAAALNQELTGQIVKVVFVPDAVDTPTTLYDVQLKNEDGVDVLNGAGTDLVVTGPVQKVPNIAGFPVTTQGHPVHIQGKMQLLVGGAGAAKKGKVILTLAPPSYR